MSRATRPRTPFMSRRIGSPEYVRASSTHSAMATRAGVAGECNTSHRPQRSSARSMRASETTGYCGATAVIRASRASRNRTTFATSSRASATVSGSPSVARWRSRIASAVRCPNSASNTAARASRRPARRLRARSSPPSRRGPGASGPDAIDHDGHAAELHPEQPLHGRRDRVADLDRQWSEPLARPGDEPDGDMDAPVLHTDADGRPADEAPPAWTAAADAQHAGDLERREADGVADHARSDAEAGHQEVASDGTGSASSSLPASPPASSAIAAAPSAAPFATDPAESVSPIRSRTRSPAAVAPT